MVDDSGPDRRREGHGRVRLPAQLIGIRALSPDGPEGLKHVVVHDEGDRDRGIEGVSDGAQKLTTDVFQIERPGERGRQAEDRSELLLPVLFSGTRTGERAREAMHDHGGDETDAEPDDERDELNRRENVFGVVPRDDETTFGELDRVDVLHDEKDEGGVEGRRRHVKVQRARQLSHLPALARHRTG